MHLTEAASKDFNFSSPEAGGFKRVVMAPGRFQPPHGGHEAMIKQLVSFGRKMKAEPVIVVVSGSTQSEKNPLAGGVRVQALRSVFKGIMVIEAKNPFEATEQLFKKKMVPVGIVAGSDRANDYKRLGDFYQIPGFKTDSLKRDPDAEGIASFSATRVRERVADNDLAGFLKMMPKAMSPTMGKRLFREIAKILGVNPKGI
jgi:FAD synthase